MKTTNKHCPDCGELLGDFAGLSNKEHLMCNNPSCPSHYKYKKCPECNSTKKNVIEIIGLGKQKFKCADCGHEW